MEITVKAFNELSNNELFDIYKLRVSVFVVEQHCPYQEVDDFDKSAIHLLLKDSGRILAYLRVLPQNTVFEDASIGRVISADRRKGYGSKIVSEGIRIAAERFGAEYITIEAQTYARTLYEKLGFEQISDEFLEDGIPHIKMRLKIKHFRPCSGNGYRENKNAAGCGGSVSGDCGGN